MEQIKATLNISIEVKNTIIPEIDRLQYGLLNGDRFDLFNMAVAIGVTEDKATPLNNHDSFVRTERLNEDILSKYRAIYYDKVIVPEQRSIDEIVNTNALLELIEQYANTGFHKLKEYMGVYDSETFLYKLLSDATSLYNKEYIVNGGVAEDEEPYGNY